MPVDIATAQRDAAGAARARGGRVQAHPEAAAIEDAIVLVAGGTITAVGRRSEVSVPPSARVLDCAGVLAHTFPTELDGRPWDRALPSRMSARGMALIPTLKLFSYELGRANLPSAVVERVTRNAREQLLAFRQLGGQVLFGTDVGYMTDEDPTDEYVAMQDAGLTYPAILAALTTAPAARFGAAKRTGRLAKGMAADVVVVDGRPDRDIRALTRVRLVLRNGRVLYERAP